ncbi:hypothetical protein SDRG_05367 [Saprolegnia diclina VS20]|uniref:Ricin B lectin domain-containing protein n=1 Tax=Saprolegnia diclina (strain VS20) TaxID=1156394 RepID=T0QT06_SAPDV|nr:hypothetical protein SDRG_05367 [Saprolegnia diclina VS20]EQC37140.1 hypothetical protein SDRG_05367 [Saprolegnia diclina VS20]|eukprot:XP_008609302.1 hypothetical protein SDRG_05367 [Saprolegnia diclina VS20]
MTTASLASSSTTSQYGSVPATTGKINAPEGLSKKLWAGAVVAATMVAAGVVMTTGSSDSTIIIATLEDHAPTVVEDNGLLVVESAFEAEQLFRPVEHKGLTKQKKSKKTKVTSTIHVDDTQVKQEILGFGGAFTEAAAIQFKKLSPELQEEVLRLYFDKETGAGYTIGRVPMNSCDYSPGSYSFDDVVDDVTLSHFDMNVTHDHDTMIPFIQAALAKRPDIKLFLSPWSPPAWMKLPDGKGKQTMTGSVQPVGLDPKYRSAWALYFSKFITAYQGQNISFWGLTPQNEPMFAAPWEACSYDAQAEAAFVADYLGPQIRQDHPDVKIMVFDHNRDAVTQWAQAAYNKAAEYVDGVAVHWYNGGGRELDGVLFHTHLNDTHHLNPDKFILATESCNCPDVASGADGWFRGQRYAHDILGNLNNWAVGWVDWNLMLDHTGGPNHLGNTCDAPIIMNPAGDNFTLQPMYHFIKHFSQFAPPGSKRIASDIRVEYAAPGIPDLYTQYPAAAHHCDKSSRQSLYKTQDSKIKVTDNDFCIDVVHEWFGNKIELVKCIYTSNSWTFGDDGSIHFRGQCLATAHGSLESGAALTLEQCVDADHQKWTFVDTQLVNKATGLCATAGYAFAQAIAFKTPEDKKVLVVLNENSEDASFTLTTNDGRQVETTVPKGAIRTYQWA